MDSELQIKTRPKLRRISEIAADWTRDEDSVFDMDINIRNLLININLMGCRSISGALLRQCCYFPPPDGDRP